LGRVVVIKIPWEISKGNILLFGLLQFFQVMDLGAKGAKDPIRGGVNGVKGSSF